MKEQRWLGWHFLAEDGRLPTHTNAEGKKVKYYGRKVEVGRTYFVNGQPVSCQHGLHASRNALDALKYAPGPICCRVELGGIIVDCGDKSVAQRRTVLSMFDASPALHEFACWCASRALHAERQAGREPDKRSWDAIRIKRLWLRGKATDDELAAARAAAGSLAWDAAWGAALAAALALAVAGGTAWGAAGSLAWDAAWDAARDAQLKKLERMMLRLRES